VHTCTETDSEGNVKLISQSKQKEKIFPKEEFHDLRDSDAFVCPACLAQCPCSKCNPNPLMDDLLCLQKGTQYFLTNILYYFIDINNQEQSNETSKKRNYKYKNIKNQSKNLVTAVT
jgi:hypothetical protein